MGIEFFEFTTRPKVCRRWESNALFTENFISLSVWKSDVLYKWVNATAAFVTFSEWGWKKKGELSEGKNTFFSWHRVRKWFKKRRIFLLPMNYCLKKNVFLGEFRNFASRKIRIDGCCLRFPLSGKSWKHCRKHVVCSCLLARQIVLWGCCPVCGLLLINKSKNIINLMEITGKIIKALEPRSGVSARSGSTWCVQEFVIETVEGQ